MADNTLPYLRPSKSKSNMTPTPQSPFTPKPAVPSGWRLPTKQQFSEWGWLAVVIGAKILVGLGRLAIPGLSIFFTSYGFRKFHPLVLWHVPLIKTVCDWLFFAGTGVMLMIEGNYGCFPDVPESLQSKKGKLLIGHFMVGSTAAIGGLLYHQIKLDYSEEEVIRLLVAGVLPYFVVAHSAHFILCHYYQKAKESVIDFIVRHHIQPLEKLIGELRAEVARLRRQVSAQNSSSKSPKETGGKVAKLIPQTVPNVQKCLGGHSDRTSPPVSPSATLQPNADKIAISGKDGGPSTSKGTTDPDSKLVKNLSRVLNPIAFLQTLPSEPTDPNREGDGKETDTE